MPDPRREFAVEVVRRLRGAGHVALWAGGCVRDLLLGSTPSDYDVATDAPPERVMRLFRHTVPVGVSFGVVRVLGPKPAGEVEVATFRSDGAYVDGRRPESVVFGSPEVDASRRDFTINGMFLDPLSDEVIDFVGGRADLDRRVLRAVGDPSARFAEDKLRLLRAVRFAARFDLAFDPATWSALVAMAPLVRQVAAERIAQELRKLLVHASRRRGMTAAMDSGLVAAILPPLMGLVGIDAGTPPHPGEDHWAHTLRVLDLLPESPSFPLAFAALLHEAGPEAAEELSRDLKLANDERERVTWLVARRLDLIDPASLPTSTLKRRLAVAGIDELLALHRAEALATTGDASHVDYCEHYLRDEPAGPIDPPPLLTGRDLAQHGLTPGPLFKTLLDEARDAQLDGLITTKEQALAWLKRRDESG